MQDKCFNILYIAINVSPVKASEKTKDKKINF